jgi:hypothetical protein
VKKQAYIIKSSENGRRHVCIDRDNEKEILDFLKKESARIKKFHQRVDAILIGAGNREIYEKEDIDPKVKTVGAIKMFKGGQNIRIYCKEQSTPTGEFLIIVAELLKKKKDQKIKGTTKSLVKKVNDYEYEIIERECESLG